MSKIEQFTEALIMDLMQFSIGLNDFGYVYPQGNITDIKKIEDLLKKAGGKPKECELNYFSKGGNGKAKPEFIITLKDDINTIIVVECKKQTRAHSTLLFDKPNGFSVDGALYYAKFLKEEYNVIAIGVSGTEKDKTLIDVFYWGKGQETPQKQNKLHNIFLTPINYLKAIKGEKISKAYSLDEIRTTALEFHDKLREIKVTEKQKPVFIAGILIALENQDFCRTYASLPSFKSVITQLNGAIEEVLNNSDIKKNKISHIKDAFKSIGNNEKLKDIPLGTDNSITWYIEQLEMKIKPMMNNADSSLDALGVFYHEFVKYSGGDGKGLGIVLTPQHLTEFMCEIADVDHNSYVADICCGSASFLVSAMNKMFKTTADPKKLENIRRKQLHGIELDQDLYVLAIANMIIRKDGKSNIIHGDCFNETYVNEMISASGNKLNVGLLNPPYSQKDKEELEFVEQLLNALVKGGKASVVVPMSCAIGTKFKETRKRLFERHTLKAVFSMPDDIFYPTGTNVCVMLWEAHKPHKTDVKTFFGYCKDDGFVKRKKLGRVDAYEQWETKKKHWIDLYRNSEELEGLSAKKSVDYNDEWLCEAYMKTDYSSLSKSNFEKTIRDFLSYLVRENITDLKSNFKLFPSMKLDANNWVEYDLTDFFEMCAGKFYYKEDYLDGNTPYVSASNTTNGIMTHIDLIPDFKGNCITIGKVGMTTFYQQLDFCATSDVTVLTPKSKVNFNKYIGMFLITVLNMQGYKWSYGRQIRLGDCREIKIKLPTKDGIIPDWELMEKYIKSLNFSDKI